MIEAQRVHPAFVDDVVHGRPIVGIRPFGEARHHLSHRSDVIEVAEDERGTRLGSFEA